MLFDAVDPTDLGWRTNRRCGALPMSVFFPPEVGRGGNYDWTRPRRVCSNCPVRVECLAWWLATTPRQHDSGYVGGTAPSQREAIRHRLTREAAA